MRFEKGALYLVGTPIGNMGDMSPRAAEVLGAADFIAAEDTRVAARLLAHFGIEREVVSFYAHNAQARAHTVLRRLREGESCALVTDAGMPGVSDPGENLVALCRAEGLPVYAVPGPCALVAAVALSGLRCGRFSFEGFLPVQASGRAKRLRELADERRAIVLYCAPHKLQRDLRDLLGALGDRPVSVSRELTKLHEETLTLTLSGALAHFEETQPRGEFTLVIEGAPEPKREAPEIAPELLNELYDGFRAQGMSGAEAMRQAAGRLGLTRNEAYALRKRMKGEEE